MMITVGGLIPIMEAAVEDVWAMHMRVGWRREAKFTRRGRLTRVKDTMSEIVGEDKAENCARFS